MKNTAPNRLDETVSQTSPTNSLEILRRTLLDLWNCSLFVVSSYSPKWSFPGVALVDMRFGARPETYNGTFQPSGHGLLRRLSNGRVHNIFNICSILQICWVTCYWSALDYLFTFWTGDKPKLLLSLLKCEPKWVRMQLQISDSYHFQTWTGPTGACLCRYMMYS